MGLRGMSKHVRACSICCVLAVHFIYAFGLEYSNRRSPAIDMLHTLNR